ncbi:MAG: hypothetical protein KC620_14525 [Myxococcales bacterium]|nr:hypothetical protein [Myxococcales bacterium]
MVALSIIALVAGPLLARLLRPARALMAALDGFILTAIGGLVLFDVLPPALYAGGGYALVALAAGVGLPVLSERHLHRGAITHRGVLIVALLGLSVHALIDGAALVGGVGTAHANGYANGYANGHAHGHEALAWSVVLHRVPVGLLLWWTLAPRGGGRVLAMALALIASATVVGFAAGDALLPSVPPVAMGVFVALAAGALLHVVLHALEPEHDHGHADHHHGHGHPPPAEDGPASTVGALFGVAVVLAVSGTERGHVDALPQMAGMAACASPWLLGAWAVAWRLRKTRRLAPRAVPALIGAALLLAIGVHQLPLPGHATAGAWSIERAAFAVLAGLAVFSCWRVGPRGALGHLLGRASAPR